MSNMGFKFSGQLVFLSLISLVEFYVENKNLFVFTFLFSNTNLTNSSVEKKLFWNTKSVQFWAVQLIICLITFSQIFEFCRCEPWIQSKQLYVQEKCDIRSPEKSVTTPEYFHWHTVTCGYWLNDKKQRKRLKYAVFEVIQLAQMQPKGLDPHSTVKKKSNSEYSKIDGWNN